MTALLSQRGTAVPAAPRSTHLPTWPMTVLFAGFPVWWLVGLVDIAWIIVAGVMTLFLAQAPHVRVPRGFGVWLLFLLWAAASVVMLPLTLTLLGFGYRLGIYLACTVIAVYVYNSWATLTERFVTGCLTAWWLATVAGGYLGLLLPSAVLRTPMSVIVPQSLLGNDLVNHMVVRRLAQYNVDSFLGVAPRPSAPFLYTNNWGNVYSLLLPFVLVYLFHVRREMRARLLVLALIASTVPALLTLNRGMFLGLGLALLYAAFRLTLQGRFRAVLALGVLSALVVGLSYVLPVQDRLSERLDASAEATSNDTRASLYMQALELVPESPVFGFGAPQPPLDVDTAPVGTQGQVWMLLVSHGPVATVLFVGWFLIALGGTWRRTDPGGLASQTVLLVGTVELFYYGIVPNGLPILMVAAALGLRGSDDQLAAGAGREPRAPQSIGT